MVLATLLIIVDADSNDELNQWIDRFEKDEYAAAYDFWYEMHKGIHEKLREFPS